MKNGLQKSFAGRCSESYLCISCTYETDFHFNSAVSLHYLEKF